VPHGGATAPAPTACGRRPPPGTPPPAARHAGAAPLGAGPAPVRGARPERRGPDGVGSPSDATFALGVGAALGRLLVGPAGGVVERLGPLGGRLLLGRRGAVGGAVGELVAALLERPRLLGDLVLTGIALSGHRSFLPRVGSPTAPRPSPDRRAPSPGRAGGTRGTGGDRVR